MIVSSSSRIGRNYPMTSSFVITIHDTKIQEAKYIEVEIEREKDRVTGVLWIV